MSNLETSADALDILPPLLVHAIVQVTTYTHHEFYSVFIRNFTNKGKHSRLPGLLHRLAPLASEAFTDHTGTSVAHSFSSIQE